MDKGGSVSFSQYLKEMMSTIEGLVLCEINGPNKEVLYKVENPGIEEQRLESVLLDQAYEIFEDIDRLSPSKKSDDPNIVSATFGAMQIIQFRSGSYYGSIIADSFSNTGQIIEFSKTICNALSMLGDIEKEFRGGKNRIPPIN
ncbi:hypothetical protein AYI68_g7166 [Smittium mucronatum]|uniref:Uncharacterized protein n=1 Tax=Smittium mucronatum TaxID=133383 RepID=A0A1R0GPI3_9FUNG|nr:hypothetical protein AYI68_g7166 [Smittium mucronatum]